MVSENPPRHSKKTDEPVTIDLEAQEIAAAADTEKKPEEHATPRPKNKPTSDLNASLDATKEHRRGNPDRGRSRICGSL